MFILFIYLISHFFLSENSISHSQLVSNNEPTTSTYESPAIPMQIIQRRPLFPRDTTQPTSPDQYILDNNSANFKNDPYKEILKEMFNSNFVVIKLFAFLKNIDFKVLWIFHITFFFKRNKKNSNYFRGVEFYFNKSTDGI